MDDQKAKMKVVHLLSAYFRADEMDFASISSHGGAERFAAELAKSVSQHVSTTLITFGEVEAHFFIDKLEIIVLKSNKNFLHTEGKTYRNMLRLIKYLRDFDIIHAHQYYTDQTMIAAIYARLSHKKFYVTDLGGRGLTISRYFPVKLFVNKFLGMTNYDKETFKVSDNKFIPIYGGVDLKRYSPVYDKQKQVIFVGRLLPHKGIEYLIEAIEPGVKCYIAGRPYDKQHYVSLQTLAKARDIIFLTDAKDEEIINLVQSSSVLVLPSVCVDYNGKSHKNPELFGLVVAEAFACGTPAIVSDAAALPFVVKDRVTGYVVPQNDSIAIRSKIHKLLNNTKLVSELGHNARSLAEAKYNWNKVASSCIDAYGIKS